MEWLEVIFLHSTFDPNKKLLNEKGFNDYSNDPGQDKIIVFQYNT